MSIEIGEHLLTAFEALVDEEDYGDALVCEIRTFSDRGLDGGPAMLAVVNYNLTVHCDAEPTNPASIA